MKSITVFCGASEGDNPIYKETGFNVGKLLANHSIEVVFGGGRIGIMGAVADGALSRNGRVTGVLPEFLQSKELAHDSLTELILVASMHERKLKMHQISDGVIALPGGFGTLEELFEILTWGQLGLHSQPVGLLNLNGFYNGLLHLADTMVESGLLKASNRNLMLVDESFESLLGQMRRYRPSIEPKWIKETLNHV